jgi:tetratricopeptide (TPR) repeat protein
LAPRSAAAYANLARTLTSDLLGRHFRPGMDWAGAAQAYSKALELDPSDVAIRMDYAILLEHDEGGLRYAPGTRLDEAIEEYRKAQRQLGPRNRLEPLEANLALALLFCERYAELEKLAARAAKSTAWRGFLVAAVAAQHGMLDADRKATEVSADADARREILQNAAEYLQEARLYTQASSFYEAAAQGAAKGEELQAKAKAFAGMRRMGDSELSQDPARRVVQQLLAAALSGSKAAATIPPLLVNTASAADKAAAMEALHRAVRPALETARDNQVPPLRIIDGVLLQSEISVEGDAAAGFRVRVSGEQLNTSTWHVVMEQGQARLLPPETRATAVDAASDAVARWNNTAWAAVASGHVTQQVLEDALSAVKRTKQENAACLHALAALYAELDKTSEALENLRRAVDIHGECREGADWYVLGRIAEQYGLTDVAAGLYRKVPSRPVAAADDVFVLAQRRLKKVEK